VLDTLVHQPAQRAQGPTNDANCGFGGSAEPRVGPKLRSFPVRFHSPTVSPSIFGTVALLWREETLKRVGRAGEA